MWMTPIPDSCRPFPRILTTTRTLLGVNQRPSAKKPGFHIDRTPERTRSTARRVGHGTAPRGVRRETEELTAGSPLRNVRMAYSPIASDQRIVVTVSDDGWLDAYVCTPTCTVTNNLGQVWSTPSNADYRFDIAYEELSGRALLVYGV